jgi:aldehyde:ferredoxin oxidoreductase
MKGFFNKLLRIRLDEKRFAYEEIPDSVLERTLGGKGLGVHLLLAENPPGVDPLSPENRFIITVGPVTGTRMWSQSRFAVFSKSPATGGYGESYCGGSLAPKIKGCGVDAVILEGACDSLSFLRIDENGVSFHDASAIRGKDAFESEDYILQCAGEGAGAMVIGPAGENRVGFACIKSDKWRSLGRGGMGAVLGSKRVKGIAFAGGRKAEIADEELLRELIRAISAKGKDSPVTANYQKLGTPNQVKVTNGQNCFPTRYWTSGHFEHWEKLSAPYMQEHFDVSRHGCPTCFLQCTKLSKVREGRHAGLVLEGPEYETIYAIGGLNCLDSLEEVAFLNDLCDRLGLDTMSAGNVSAFAVEAFKRGKTDFPIDYNQPDRIAELYGLISRREGVGDLFADGVKGAAARLGLEDIAVHVKGLEPGGFEPRVLKGMGLSFATSPRGACHLRGTFYKAELSGEIPKDQIEGKAKLQIDYEDRSALFDCMVLCRFFRDFILWDELSTLVKATTGMVMGKPELETLANRVTQQTRRFNTREGVGPASDTLPARFFKEKTAEGASLSRAELETMVAEYNQIRSAREAEELAGGRPV